jgi:type IV secretory pathway VirB10-like protein
MNKRLFFAAILVIGGSDRNLRDSSSDVKGRSNEIERVTRDAKKPESRPPENPPAPNFEQIKEDFERIQIINGDVLQAPVPSGGHDYERISESASELNNRATRLRSNLFPPQQTKESKEKQPQADVSEYQGGDSRRFSNCTKEFGRRNQNQRQDSKRSGSQEETRCTAGIEVPIGVSWSR